MGDWEGPRSPDVLVVGLGPAGLSLLPPENLRLLKAARLILLRTARHPAAIELRDLGIRFETLDALYDRAGSFEELYPSLAAAVLEAAAAGPVVYAVPGHPLVGEQSVRLLLAAARERGLSTVVVPAMSFVDAAIAALADAGEYPEFTDWQVVDAAPLERVWWDPCRPTWIFQIDDGSSASRVKLALLEEYPDDFPVIIVRRAGQADASVARAPVRDLDRAAAGEYDHLTALFLSGLPPDRRAPGFQDFVELIATLRGPAGCPWDREQNYATLKRYVLEEAYEVLEAVDSQDPDRLCEELGDLILQVLMLAQFAREDGFFDIRDVTAGVVRKLVRRHPHVFGDAAAATAEDVKRNWDTIKSEEKPERTSVLDGIPRGLPALMSALEVSKRVVAVGFEWPALDGVLDKLDEEVRELKEELHGGSREKQSAELGDLLFTIVNLARWLKIDPEEALRQMVERFGVRFREVERLAAASGRPLKTMDIVELDRLWDEAKARTDDATRIR